MFKRTDWRKRAEAAESALAQTTRLIEIGRNGRVNVFTFIRGDDVIKIETIGTWDDDVAQWRKDLLE